MKAITRAISRLWVASRCPPISRNRWNILEAIVAEVRKQVNLWSIVPDAEILIRLDMAQLAHAIMSCLRSYNPDSLNLSIFGFKKSSLTGTRQNSVTQSIGQFRAHGPGCLGRGIWGRSQDHTILPLWRLRPKGSVGTTISTSGRSSRHLEHPWKSSRPLRIVLCPKSPISR